MAFRDEIAWFIQQRRAEPRYAGIVGLSRLTLHLLLDTLRSAPREHFRAIADRTDAANDTLPTREDRMATLLHDLRYALRTLAHRRGFTATVVLTLMLGIGANTAIFSIVNAVLLRPLPYANGDQLVIIWGKTATQPQALMPIPAVDELQKRSRSFTELGMARSQSVNLTGTDRPDRLTGNFVTAASLRLFGPRMTLGRIFSDEDTRLGAGAKVAVLSNAVWRSRFGGDPAILGKSLILNGRPHEVIGVTAPDFDLPLGPNDVWLPITSAPSASWFTPASANVWSFGRLKPGTTVAQGQAELSGIVKQLIAEQPVWAGSDVSVIGLHEYVIGPLKPTLLIILGAVTVVLLIACANVANLQLARATSRAREMSVRAALGASRSRLIRQLLTESVVLSVLGGTAGIIAAHFGTQVLVAMVPGGLPMSGAVGLDAGVLLFAALITIATGLIFGLAPAFYAARADVHHALRSRAADGTRGGFTLRNAFVAIQLALCIVLLVGAGLFTRSLVAMQRVDPGFKTDHLLTAEFRLPSVKYTTQEQTQLFMTSALAALRQTPGVRSVALGRTVPMGGNFGTVNYVAQGQPEPAGGAAPTTQQNSVSDAFFSTMGIPLKAGRDFNNGDVATGEQVVIVNERFAEVNWPGSSAIGKHVRIIGPPDADLVVVGVVGTIRHRFLNDEPTPQIYQPMSQNGGIFNSVVMRTSGDAEASTQALRAAIWSVDPDQPVWKIRSMERLLGQQTAASRFTVTLTASFALVALLLATIGVYGVMAFAVAQRTREVGIRMALGARKEQVVNLIVRRGIKVVLIAVAGGTVAAVWVAGLVENQLFAVKAADPLTLVVVPVLLTVVALLACWIPARRAARIDPAITLRSE